MKPTFHMFYIFSIFSFCISPVLAAHYDVTGLIVESVSQNEDDEEAPFDIRATNKRHKCGGKSSNLFRVYSEFNIVSDRKFEMAILSMRGNLTLSVSTHGCKGKALTVEKMKISR